MIGGGIEFGWLAEKKNYLLEIVWIENDQGLFGSKK
jgi:hypothetical protein